MKLLTLPFLPAYAGPTHHNPRGSFPMSFHYPSKDAATAAVYDAAILLLEAPLGKPLPKSVRDELREICHRVSLSGSLRLTSYRA